MSYINNIPIRGLPTRYERLNSTVEVLMRNSGIRKFVFEHMENVDRILQQIKYTREMFLGPKTTICSDHIIIVGFDCSYKGKRPTYNAIGKILYQGACENITDVRVFLGVGIIFLIL